MAAPREPLLDAVRLVRGRWWAWLPVVLLWGETFVSWPLSLWVRGRLGTFDIDAGAPALALPSGEWWTRALESGAAAMVPVARSGWVSLCTPALALLAMAWVAFGPRMRELEEGERPFLIGLAATGAMASVGNLLGQMVWSRGGMDAATWSWFRVGGTVLRTVIVPATLGAVWCWAVMRPLTTPGTRTMAITRLSLMCLAAGVLLGMPDTLREGGSLGTLGQVWIWCMPLMGCAGLLLVAWAIRPAYILDWLARPVVLVAVGTVVAAQVGLSGLRGAMPPVEAVLILGKSNLDWDGQLSVWGWALNVAIAAVQIAAGFAAVAAVAAVAPERRG